jgi:hypothetical protein
LCVWKFNEESDKVDFIYEINQPQFKQGTSSYVGGITSTKWLEEQVLAVSLTNGTVQLKDMRIGKE